MKNRLLVIWILFLVGLSACQSDDPLLAPVSPDLPSYFPELPIPKENQLTVGRVKLGKLLFFDPGLSRDSTVSCASCHLPIQAFADHESISIGIEGRKGFRNVPSLGNVGFHPYFFAEGGSPSLELQVLGPLENEDEMGFNAAELQLRFDADTTYDALARKAYGRDMDIYVLTRALASFERTMVSANSRYDQFIQSQDSTLFTSQELAGMQLFFSEATQCATCHPAPLFTDFSFQHIGLYPQYKDGGRYRITQVPEDHGRFKVPSLRNVALTAPYMHDGSMQTLTEVVAHFAQGGVGHRHQSERVRPLDISESQQAELVAFLKTLTDYSFANNPSLR